MQSSFYTTCRCHSVEMLKTKLSLIDSEELQDPDKFRDFYFFIFRYIKVFSAKVERNMAIMYWKLVLADKFPLFDMWCQFLEVKSKFWEFFICFSFHDFFYFNSLFDTGNYDWLRNSEIKNNSQFWCFKISNILKLSTFILHIFRKIMFERILCSISKFYNFVTPIFLCQIFGKILEKTQFLLWILNFFPKIWKLDYLRMFQIFALSWFFRKFLESLYLVEKSYFSRITKRTIWPRPQNANLFMG